MGASIIAIKKKKERERDGTKNQPRKQREVDLTDDNELPCGHALW